MNYSVIHRESSDPTDIGIVVIRTTALFSRIPVMFLADLLPPELIDRELVTAKFGKFQLQGIPVSECYLISDVMKHDYYANLEVNSIHPSVYPLLTAWWHSGQKTQKDHRVLRPPYVAQNQPVNDKALTQSGLQLLQFLQRHSIDLAKTADSVLWMYVENHRHQGNSLPDWQVGRLIAQRAPLEEIRKAISMEADIITVAAFYMIVCILEILGYELPEPISLADLYRAYDKQYREVLRTSVSQFGIQLDVDALKVI